jgi:hypothetical protein
MVDKQESTMNKTQAQKLKKEQIQSLLAKDDRAVVRALVRIYERQTADEQRSEETKHHNEVGFRANDAKYMTMAAKFALRNGRLDDYHLQKVRGRIMHYWRQLAEIAEEQNAKRIAMGKETVPLCGRQK